jgi:hypothetical protein
MDPSCPNLIYVWGRRNYGPFGANHAKGGLGTLTGSVQPSYNQNTYREKLAMNGRVIQESVIRERRPQLRAFK